MTGGNAPARPVMDVSVATTLFNEAETVTALLDSILEGTAAPAEVVVADGGSTDGTAQVLDDYAADHHEVKVLHIAAGRSAGRNAAIAASTHEVITCIDGGCRANPEWLENLVRPFDNGAEWVGGFYEPKGRTALSTAIGLTMVYVREEAEHHFVPSARSLAFTRRAWEEAGGFPEDLQFGEDTAFALALMTTGRELVFAPDAVVDWSPPANLVAQARTMYSWGRGDGLASAGPGLDRSRTGHYWRLLGLLSATTLLLVITAVFEPRLLPLAVLPMAPLVWRQTRYKYRHMQGWSKWFLIPLATVNGWASSLAGFLNGRWAGRQAG